MPQEWAWFDGNIKAESLTQKLQPCPILDTTNGGIIGMSLVIKNAAAEVFNYNDRLCSFQDNAVCEFLFL